MGDDFCRLHATNNVVRHCDETKCVFWRAVGQLGYEETGEGCAIQYFELLGDESLVAWLLSVKERVDGEAKR